MPNESKEQRENLLKLITAAVQKDKALRAQFAMGDKFRFIRERLEDLQRRIDAHLNIFKEGDSEQAINVAADESLVYVYLYNAQGLTLKTWQKMLNESVFYEYSVNRPIYIDKAAVEAFIRSRPNPAQHGFITVIVKNEDILKVPEGMPATQDALGNQLVKVREGSLTFKKLLAFTHNSEDYKVNNSGEILKS